MNYDNSNEPSPVILALVQMKQAVDRLIIDGADAENPVYCLFLKDTLETELGHDIVLESAFFDWCIGFKDYITLNEASEYLNKMIIGSCEAEIRQKLL